MATDQVLDSSSSVPHGRLLKLDVNKQCVNTELMLKSVCILCVVAHTVLLAVWRHIVVAVDLGVTS